MLVRYAFGVALGGLVATTALAAPITAKDGSGTVYQLNDDGTWSIVVETDTGKTLLLSPEGHWWDADEDAGLEQRFLSVLDTTFASGNVPNPSEQDWPKYRDCLVALFNAMPQGARRIMVSGNDPRVTYKKLETQFPDAARQLNNGDKTCRQGISFSKK